MKTLVTLLAVSFAAFGATANFSDEYVEFTHIGSNGVVHTYPSCSTPMGLDYSVTDDWMWQTSENNGQTVTVDPYTGAYTSRFYIANIFETSGLYGNGMYWDAANNYIYVADYNGDGGVTMSDGIYCFDVDDPDSPIVIDTWNLGTLSGILGVTYKDPYFYCTYYSGSMKRFTLNPGGTWVDEGTYSSYGRGDIWYDEAWDCFYTHTAIGATVYVLDGTDPNTQLDTFNPGCTLADGICSDPDPDYLWTSDFNTTSNYVFDDEYIPIALERTTWGEIKSNF